MNNSSNAARVRAVLRRMGLVLLLLATCMFGSPLMAPASAAYSITCSGYTSCANAGLGSGGYNDSTNQQMYWNSFAGHNCTNYVAYRMIRLGVSSGYAPGNAANWGPYFAARGVAVNSTPAVGAIAWWNSSGSGGYTGSTGHVALVERVNADGSIDVSEDNWGANFHWKHHTPGYSWPSGFIHLKDQPSSISDGQFVSYAGHVYRIAGGAPIYVSTWDRFGGPQPTTALSDAQWNALPTYPRDGTLISGQAAGQPDHGSVFRVVGGAPVYVSSFAAIGGDSGTIAVDLSAILNAGGGSPWNHLRYFPADGTFVSDQDGSVYRFAGGAPIYVSNFTNVGGTGGQPVTRVDKAALERTAATGAWSHVRLRPADGTFVSDQDGSVYRFAGGAPIYVSNFTNVGGTGGQPVIRVDKAALQRTDTAGAYSHVFQKPADGTFVSGNMPGDPEHGGVYVFAGGAPIRVSSWANVGGPKPTTVVDLAALRRTEAAGAWSHVRFWPADGTVLDTGAAKFVTQDGSPISSTTSSAGTRVDAVAVANAGGAGWWSHLKAVPVPSSTPTPTPTPPPSTTAPSAASRTVVVTAVRHRSMFRVAVGPPSASTDYKFVVQRRARRGVWKYVGRKSTKGPRDVRLVDVRRGVYRVVLPAAGDSARVVSNSVRLRR